jgi:hypothetical protein
MRNATVTLFKGGHSPFLEQPALFVRGFEGFVEGLKSDAAPRLALAS